tara:strand:- start:1066 stop:1281 length:216 start_codon:yes stop_codon:yes gene_type:complete
MIQKTFNDVLTTAIAWDSVSDEDMTYPTFDTVAELELFENFLCLLNDFELLDKLGFINSYKHQDKDNTDGI